MTVKLKDTASPAADFKLRPGGTYRIRVTLNDPPGTLTTDTITGATFTSSIYERDGAKRLLIGSIAGTGIDNTNKTVDFPLVATDSVGWRPGWAIGDVKGILSGGDVRRYEDYEFEVERIYTP